MDAEKQIVPTSLAQVSTSLKVFARPHDDRAPAAMTLNQLKHANYTVADLTTNVVVAVDDGEPTWLHDCEQFAERLDAEPALFVFVSGNSRPAAPLNPATQPVDAKSAPPATT